MKNGPMYNSVCTDSSGLCVCVCVCVCARACVRACVCRTVCGPVLRVADRDLAGIDNEALDFHIEDYINGDGSM